MVTQQTGRALPVVAITLGDPAGIGPEIIVRTLSHPELYRRCRPLVVGDAGTVEEACLTVGIPLITNPVPTPSQGRYQHGTLDLLDLANVDRARLRPGKPTSAGAKAARQFLEAAGRLALKGEVDALVTAPTGKPPAATRDLGHCQEQAEALAAISGSRHWGMMLAVGSLYLVEVVPQPLSERALGTVSRGAVVAAIKLAHRAMRALGGQDPGIGVLGMGRAAELEAREVVPAIQVAAQAGIRVVGPITPESLQQRAAAGEFEAVVCMCRDQVNLGALRQDTAVPGSGHVCVTIGLPFIHTSVGHGPEFEAAGQGLATEQAMQDAVLLAVRMAQARVRGASA